MLLKQSKNQSSFKMFIRRSRRRGSRRTSSPMAVRCSKIKKAYKILVNQGHKDRADRFFYNQPERPISMTLKGPSGTIEAYIDAFNEAFGVSIVGEPRATAAAPRVVSGRSAQPDGPDHDRGDQEPPPAPVHRRLQDAGSPSAPIRALRTGSKPSLTMLPSP